ncbi:MAG: hypothetical protein ACO3AS_12930, partial [Burkholderiaceae bacterium]
NRMPPTWQAPFGQRDSAESSSKLDLADFAATASASRCAFNKALSRLSDRYCQSRKHKKSMKNKSSAKKKYGHYIASELTSTG